MSRILYFLYTYRAFFLFVVLESFSGWLIIQNNQYQSAHFFNSSNTIVATILNFTHQTTNYFSLRDVNKRIAEENAKLKTALEEKNENLYSLNARETKDSTITNQFIYINAEVMNNSVNQFKNYITIDKGSNEGVSPGMAVVGLKGAIGKVKFTSQHYSVVTSLLNINTYVSSVVKDTNYFGTIKWRGTNNQYIHFEFIPRHAFLSVGDTIVTSGFNSIFPKDIQIGVISHVHLKKEEQFYDIEVKLAQDFTRIAFVQIIQSTRKKEQDSLEHIMNIP